MLCKELQLLFIDICKNAGTAIIATFKKQYPFLTFEGKHHSVQNWTAEGHFTPQLSRERFTCSAVTEEQLQNYTVFAVIRNPFDRMVSLWLWGRQGPYKNLSFAQFLKGISGNQFKEYNKHRYRTQLEWISDKEGNQRVHEILRYERLDQDMQQFCQAHGFEIECLLKDNTAQQRSGAPRQHYREYYTEQWMIDFVETRFAADLQTFGYSF